MSRDDRHHGSDDSAARSGAESNDDRAAELLGEFEERRRTGGPADSQELLRLHPDLAEELHAGLDAVRKLRRLSSGAAETDPPAPSGQVGDFRVLREIGRGGMGVVYEAEQASMRRRVALKILYPSITNTATAVERFQREARAAGTLKHTNIVAVHQLGEDKGVWFCAMELVDGRPLDEVLDDLRRRRDGAPGASDATPAADAWETSTGGRRYFERVAEMFADVADALQFAHGHGILHRDVKPANLVLSTDGDIKVLDFGLAAVREEEARLTLTGAVVGTPAYMSPEQARGQELDARADVYSLGATLYEVLTLRLPIEATRVTELLDALRTHDPVAPRRLDRRIPRDLETVVLKCLEKERGRRYACARDLARDLRAFAEGRAVAARHVGPLGRAWRLARRNRVRAALVASLVVAVATAATFAVLESRARTAQGEQQALRIALEYEDLLARADAPRTRDGADAAADGEAPAALYARAIALAPQRPDAYLSRGLWSGDTDVEAHLADIDAASSRGLPDVTARIARALVLKSAGRRCEMPPPPDESATPDAVALQAVLADMDGRSDEALALLARLLREAPKDGRCARLALRASYMVRMRARGTWTPAASAARPRLIASWQFEGDLRDCVGNHDGRAVGRRATFVSAPAGSAVDLNGTTDFVVVPSDPSLETPHGITVAAWVLPRDYSRNTTIVSKWNDHVEAWSWILTTNNDHSGRIGIEFSQGGHSDLGTLRGNKSLPLNDWTHVAMTYDTVTGDVRIFLNGVLDASGRGGRPGTPIRSSAVDVVIGAVNVSGGCETGGCQLWNGQIDDVMLFDGALAESEIAAMHAARAAEHSIDSDPGGASAKSSLAWLLVVGSDPARNDPKRAARLARDAARLRPGDNSIWNTLGIALCQLGEWNEARVALEKAVELSGSPEAYELFPLANAYKHLGRDDEARKCYDRGAAWMAANFPDDPPRSRLQRDAAAALGLSVEKPAPADKPK